MKIKNDITHYDNVESRPAPLYSDDLYECSGILTGPRDVNALGITALLVEGDRGLETLLEEWPLKLGIDLHTLSVDVGDNVHFLLLKHPGIELPENVEIDSGITALRDGTFVPLPPSQDLKGGYIAFNDAQCAVASVPPKLLWLIDESAAQNFEAAA